MTLCPVCGYENDDDAALCVKCRASLLDDPQDSDDEPESDVRLNGQGQPVASAPEEGQFTADMPPALQATPRQVVCYNCNRPTSPTATSCPYCGAKFSGRTVDRATHQRTLVLSHMDEPETVVPGQARPLEVLDEQVTHLAHTDRLFTPQALLERTRQIIDEYQVPVDVELRPTRWRQDATEVRERVVASLRNHAFSDIKMICGVDYLGRWANVHVLVADQPPTVPVAQDDTAWMQIVALICLLLGIGSFFMAVNGDAGAAIGGIVFVIVSFLFWTRWKAVKHQQAAEQHRQLAAADNTRLRKHFVRTFKQDDMRLFCSAMQTVYAAIVDDIIEQGAEVVRVEGGRGGMFAPPPAEAAAPVRESDAALLDV